MSWHLNLWVEFRPAKCDYVGRPGEEDEPLFTTSSLAAMVRVLEAIGRVDGFAKVNAYPDAVREEGEAMEAAVARRRAEDGKAVAAAARQILRRRRSGQ